MPIYKYKCSDCSELFETRVTASIIPECPQCASKDLDKQLSLFAVNKSVGQPAACGGCPAMADTGSCTDTVVPPCKR